MHICMNKWFPKAHTHAHTYLKCIGIHIQRLDSPALCAGADVHRILMIKGDTCWDKASCVTSVKSSKCALGHNQEWEEATRCHICHFLLQCEDTLDPDSERHSKKQSPACCHQTVLKSRRVALPAGRGYPEWEDLEQSHGPQKGKEQRLTPSLNYSKGKGMCLFNKPWLYEARLTVSLDSVEYYKLSRAHLRTSTSGARWRLSTFYII